MKTRVRLRPVRVSDYDYLYHLLSREEMGVRWRYRGSPPRPDRFVQELWDGVLAQFIIEQASGDRPTGFALAYNPNLRSGYCYVGIVVEPSAGFGTGVEAFESLTEYLFEQWPLRKLYIEAIDDNAHAFQSAIGRWLHLEGTLRDHERVHGRFADLLILSLDRTAWLERRSYRKRRAARKDGDVIGQAARSEILSEDEFVTLVAETLAITVDRDPSSGSGNSYPLDSLMAYEMLLLLEELTHATISDEVWCQIASVQDAYAYYREYLGGH